MEKSKKVINQHIDNYEFEAIEGTFVSCGDLSHGVGWVGDFKINNTTKTLDYFVKF